MTPTIRLKALLTGRRLSALQDIAGRAGIDIIAVRRAAKGQTISFDHYLLLCGAMGLDPCDLSRARARPPGRFQTRAFAKAVCACRAGRYESMREFAKATGLSLATVCRLEGRTSGFGSLSRSVSTISILRACEFMARHPFDFVSANVKRETVTETRSAA